jgi:hypothetical protein
MIFLTLTATFSPLSHNSAASANQSDLQAALASPSDPSVRNIAFNVTLAQFDLYTNRTATVQPANVTPGILAWFNSSIDGRQVNGTRFLYEIPAGQVVLDQNITWAIGIPRGSYTGGASNHTILRFRWNGTVTAGTSARYLIHNNTHVIRTIVQNSTFASGQSPSSLPCFPDEECFDVSGFIGKTLNLVFKFNSTSAGGGLKVEASYVAVASVSPQFVNPTTDIHTMNVDVDPARIIHSANSTIPVYNTTATQPVHVWNSTAVIFRFPLAYTLVDIRMNGTTALDLAKTLDTGTCSSSCDNRLPIGNRTVSSTRFISFNVTSVYSALAATIPAVIGALSPNAVGNVETALSGVATSFWVPGDLVGVRIRIEPSLNVSGAQNITLIPPTGPTPPGLDQPFNSKGGTYLYNFTLPTTAALGPWTVRGTFLNGYDFGFLTRSFRVAQINTGPLTMTGEAGQGKTLTIQGTLTYGNSSAAGGVNATLFAVDTGSPPGPVFSPYSGSPLPGLYVSNITLANGAFNENQPLRVLFTVVNPTLSTAFSANVTIQHEWYFGQGGNHGASVTFPLTLGDEPFTLSPSSTYQMDVSLTSSGVKVSVKSLTRTSVPVTHTLTAGSSAVSPFRQHFGLFNIAVTSKPFAGGTPNTNFLRSPTYAYLMADSSVTPSRLLEFGPTVKTLPSGSFTATLSGDKLLGAIRLVLFVLARDANGVVTGIGQVKTVSDSTVLTASANIPADVTIRQSITVTLSLRNNSTTLPVTLTVNVDVTGSAAFGTKTVTIQPGRTLPIDFTITAPDAAGSYLLTFSSPQYGVIATKELKVSLLQSSLQVLIPAIIGLVSALVILGLYLIRKRGGTEIVEEEKKRPPSGKPSKPTQGPSGSKSLTRS